MTTENHIRVLLASLEQATVVNESFALRLQAKDVYIVTAYCKTKNYLNQSAERPEITGLFLSLNHYDV